MTIQRGTIDQLSRLFLPDQSVRPVLLLGAGASFNSGVPLTDEMVRKITRHAIALSRGRSAEGTTDIMESDIRRFLKQQPWGASDNLSDLYPYAVQHLLTPTSVRRDFLTKVLERSPSPSPGYHSLAKIMRRGLVKTVLTTNFDSLVEDALKSLAPNSRSITTINKVRGDSVNFGPYQSNQIIYLHGAVEFYTDRNTLDETGRLDEALVTKVRSIISYSPLIVVGYRGYEASVMKHLLGEGLNDSHNYKNGIYWCSRKNSSLHTNVQSLAKDIGSNFFAIEIDGFDELMSELDEMLAGHADFQSSSTVEIKPQTTSVSPYDKTVDHSISFDDLQTDLLFSVAKTYAQEILCVDLRPEEMHKFLEANEFAGRDNNGELRPTIGLYLLVGKTVNQKLPHFKTLLIKEGKSQQVFEGNILSQFDLLKNELNSIAVNKPIRVKLPNEAVSISPYNERALLELLVNLFAHRDYERRESSEILIETGSSITFKTPGGLPSEVYRKLKPASDGRFHPVMNVFQTRNPVISDILHSQGVMDKAGSGLVDVMNLMSEHYGGTDFYSENGNKSVTVRLRQAQSSGDKIAQTATPISTNASYLTNILPFISFPPIAFRFPLEKRFAKKGGDKFPSSPEGSDVRKIGFRAFEGELWTLTDPRLHSDYFRQIGYLDHVKEVDFVKALDDPATRNLMVSLLAKAWENKLRQVDPFLRVEGKDHRAFFVKESDAGYTIVYDSAQKRNVQRAVVKKRETPTSVEYENEGIYYSVVQFGTAWGIQIKHFYLFTDSSGQDALPGMQQTRRATRRYKFDRNVAVKADLQFWSTYLSGKQATIDIGMSLIPGIAISSNFLNAEAIEL